jgi:hypothetical protein
VGWGIHLYKENLKFPSLSPGWRKCATGFSFYLPGLAGRSGGFDLLKP